VGKGSIFSPPAKNIGKSQIGIKVTPDVLAGRSGPQISHWAERETTMQDISVRQVDCLNLMYRDRTAMRQPVDKELSKALDCLAGEN
jgi:hypothetical protein